MGISKYNSEGYYDPTPHEAISSIEGTQHVWKPLVYICSPYSGDTDKNTAKARAYCRYAVDAGAIPFAPHLMLPQFMSEETERETAMFFNKVYLGRCEQLWVFGDVITDGMAREITQAKKYLKKIRYFTEECEEKNAETDKAVQKLRR